jgi:hypothetical protein
VNIHFSQYREDKTHIRSYKVCINIVEDEVPAVEVAQRGQYTLPSFLVLVTFVFDVRTIFQAVDRAEKVGIEE